MFGGGGGGGNLEIPESIDYNTQDILAGLQFARRHDEPDPAGLRVDVRNDVDTMTFENPLFITTNTIAGVASTTFTQGQIDLYPNNSTSTAGARSRSKLPSFFKSRVTGLFAFGRSQPE